ncbi:MAG: VWA domain-containing protein [Siphonobacter sp.]
MIDWFSLKWFNINTLLGYHWAVPYFLYTIPLIPLLFLLRSVFHSKERQRLHVAFLNKDIKGSWTRYLRFLPAILMGAGIALILLALARPQQFSELEQRFSEGIEIVLALDVSDSMLEKDLQPNRLESAKKVAIDFIRGRFQDKIGLVVFAGESFFLCPLTTDYNLLQQQISSIKPNIVLTAGTAIGSALANCINLMRDTNAKTKVAILLSDGDNTAGNLDPITAAQLAQVYGVKVYTIAIGENNTTTTAEGLATKTIDAEALQKIANVSNGQFFRVADTKSLRNVFNQINQLEKIEIKSTRYRETKDFYQIYLRWAIVCLLLAFATKCTFIANILED